MTPNIAGGTATVRIVLVTGAASGWGQRVATRLAGHEGFQVIGLDSDRPANGNSGLDFVQADIRNPALADLLESEAVDTVCHLAVASTGRPSIAAAEQNVEGTKHLLQACGKAGVGQVVLRSSTAVYGARPTHPAFLDEERPLTGSPGYGHTRDLVEIERFCNGFRQQSPGLAIAVLRFPCIVGPEVAARTPMMRFLTGRWAPTVLGYNPRMQLIHEEDVVGALVLAVDQRVSGVFNVAAEGVLPLNRIRGLASKKVLAVAHLAVAGAGRRWERHWPIEPDYLRFAWVADLSRMRQDLGFEPLYTAEEALRDAMERREEKGPPRLTFGRRTSRMKGGSESRKAQYLRDLIERRRRKRDRQAAPDPGGEEGNDGG